MDWDAEVDAAEPEVGSREFWRLGHRRRWWQWNVLTLFGALFILVWIRELFEVSQTATWMICLCILAAWFFAPLWLSSSGSSGREPAVDFRRYAVARVYWIALALLLIVAAWNGPMVGAMCLAAVLLYAAAVRAEKP